MNEIIVRVGRRDEWVQEAPILFGVWSSFNEPGTTSVDLLLTPFRGCLPGELAASVRTRLATWPDEEVEDWDIAFNATHVVTRTTFEQLIRGLVPMTPWYSSRISDHVAEAQRIAANKRLKAYKLVLQEICQPELESGALPPRVVWWLRLVGVLKRHLQGDANPEAADVLEAACGLLEPPVENANLFRVTSNRPSKKACLDSNRTIKADAASRLFEVDTSGIHWAVLDTGVESRHPAFNVSDDDATSRVVETWDFTRIRRLVNLASTADDEAEERLQEEFGVTADEAIRIRTSLATRRMVDWGTLEPALLVSEDRFEEENENLDPHGTHVAGILGGRAAEDDLGEEFHGMCPGLRMIDFRILDGDGRSGRDGRFDREFEIIAALQYIAYRNSVGRRPRIDGVNLSVQLPHDVRAFACGRTPVCDECNRLVSSGVVVVAAAGNKGIDSAAANATTFEGGFSDITIADPGNAELVLTVGATHRSRPHEYGVSFFSSRGPTGDGRCKPDLLAPGEKVLGPVGTLQYERMSGTSQAAPCVSGAAAMLMARFPELLGQATRVKRILVDSATDLGRERNFQGAGLLDVLRAMQSF